MFYSLWLRMAVSSLDCLVVSPLLRVRSGLLAMISVALISWTDEMRSELLSVVRSIEL